MRRVRLGQHFLVDDQVLAQITHALRPRPQDHFVEIGPGRGALTQLLLAQAKRVDAVEIDRGLACELGRRFSGDSALRLHVGDALDIDLAALGGGRLLRLAGNLPYGISSPLLKRLFGQIEQIADMHFMVQLEVANRLVARAGEPAHSRLSVVAACFVDCWKLLEAEPESFSPRPKVRSAMVRLRPRAPLLAGRQLEAFMSLVDDAFATRRKKVKHALKRHAGGLSLEALGIDPELRPQDLSADDFARVARAVAPQE